MANENATPRPVEDPFLTALYGTLPQFQDRAVVDRLLDQTTYGSLTVDRFVQFLPEPRETSHLRAGLIKVYVRASLVRQNRQATTDQIDHAHKAMEALEAARSHLNEIVPAEHTGLAVLATGITIATPLYAEGWNQLASTAKKSASELSVIVEDLKQALGAEERPRKPGPRKTRLRTLAEALLHWWEAETGDRVRIKITADRGRKVGIGVRKRKIKGGGVFADLAKAVFVEIDGFRADKVEEAIGNAIKRCKNMDV